MLRLSEWLTIRGHRAGEPNARTTDNLSAFEPSLASDHVGGVFLWNLPMNFAPFRFAVTLAAGALLWVGIMPDDPTQAAFNTVGAAVAANLIGMAMLEP
jgi:hypothetical protein